MLVAVPKLKLMGLLVFFSIILQLFAFSRPWFTLQNSNFSINAISSIYSVDMMKSICNTIETPLEFKCFCNTYCNFLREIHSNGFACLIIIIFSINCFIAEIICIRRKI